jgi:hypothetical protein
MVPRRRLPYLVFRLRLKSMRIAPKVGPIGIETVSELAHVPAFVSRTSLSSFPTRL